MVKKIKQRSLYLSLLFMLAFSMACDSKEKPNIIFIMADDLGYGDLGCYGQKLIKTPHIDKLAQQGIRFSQAYSGGSVCTPSRSVFMTGLHNGHTVARDNIPHYYTYLKEHDTTIAKVLKTSGYRCGGIGKWSLGDAGTVGRATKQGFDSWFGYLNQDHAHFYYPEYLDDDEGVLELKGNTKTREFYSHSLMTDRALRFIRESKDQPFFFYAAYTLPHFSSKEEDSHGLTVPSTKPYDHMDWDEKSKKYATMIHMLDEDVGKIVNLIDDLQLSKNTLIIFTSDNGGHRGVPKKFNTSGDLNGFKRDLTEGGIRVPFIARWTDKIPANKMSHEIISFQDMLPTFAKLAGGAVPDKLDGKSVLEALKGGQVQSPHDYLYWDYGHCRRSYDQAVRLDDWKGIRHGKDQKIKLYHLKKDPTESTDVSDQYIEITNKISKIMDKAATPSPLYPIGEIYKGKSLWHPTP